MSVGKTKAWRKVSRQYNPNTGTVERYGRKFRNAMRMFDGRKATGYPLLNTLMVRAGLTVVTPLATMESDEIAQGEVVNAA